MTISTNSFIITIIIKNVSYFNRSNKEYLIKKGRQQVGNNELDQLRQRVEEINLQLLELINERATAVQEIGTVKESQGVNKYDPVRERHMLDLIKENNNGPFEDSVILHLFKQIFKAGLNLQEDDHRKAFLFHVRKSQKIR